MNYLSIAEAACLAKVSEATIRNWVKTGGIQQIGKGKISFLSFIDFQKKNIGVDKLVKRANKLNFDSHDHEELSKYINRELKLKKYSPDEIGELYEKRLSSSYKNQEGIYYTPFEIVKDLLHHNIKSNNSTFCDPCCGSGNFIIRAIEVGFKPENIFGFDIDPIALKIAKYRILKKTGYNAENNLIPLDFLKSYNTFDKYDYIYTNPPWGKKISKQDKKEIASNLDIDVNLDTSLFFLFACLRTLKEKGYLGLVLPEAFLNIASFQVARDKILTKNILKITHYGKAFKDLQTGVIGIEILNKNIAPHGNIIKCTYNNKNNARQQNSFKKNPKLIININCTNVEDDIIEYIYSIPHISLKENATWGLGIVTGNNKKYIISKEEDGYYPVYKGSDISAKGLKEPTNFIKNDFSIYQQVAPMNLYQAKEKIIYKFISSRLQFYHDKEQRLILNSANLLIPHANFPISMMNICLLFNSNFMNWLFNKIFNTHKVLRGDIECLPIHNQFINNIFSEDLYLSKLNLERKNGTYRFKK